MSEIESNVVFVFWNSPTLYTFEGMKQLQDTWIEAKLKFNNYGRGQNGQEIYWKFDNAEEAFWYH